MISPNDVKLQFLTFNPVPSSVFYSILILYLLFSRISPSTSYSRKPNSDNLKLFV